MVMTTENRANGRLVCKWMDSPIGRLKLRYGSGLAGICAERTSGRVKFSAPVEDASHGAGRSRASR